MIQSTLQRNVGGNNVFVGVGRTRHNGIQLYVSWVDESVFGTSKLLATVLGKKERLASRKSRFSLNNVKERKRKKG